MSNANKNKLDDKKLVSINLDEGILKEIEKYCNENDILFNSNRIYHSKDTPEEIFIFENDNIEGRNLYIFCYYIKLECNINGFHFNVIPSDLAVIFNKMSTSSLKKDSAVILDGNFKVSSELFHDNPDDLNGIKKEFSYKIYLFEDYYVKISAKNLVLKPNDELKLIGWTFKNKLCSSREPNFIEPSIPMEIKFDEHLEKLKSPLNMHEVSLTIMNIEDFIDQNKEEFNPELFTIVQEKNIVLDEENAQETGITTENKAANNLSFFEKVFSFIGFKSKAS
jgi:hypothetical protein